MAFSSPLFIFLFLPLVLFLYYLTSNKFKNLLLLMASLIFYAWGEGRFTLIILGIIFLNYQTSKAIKKYQKLKLYKKSQRVLLVAILINLAFLFYYKYSFFFIGNFFSIFNHSASYKINSTPVYLPLAISFFVFHAISYNFDIFKRKATPAKNFSELSLYLLFFPHLLAGPIIRYSKIFKQLRVRVCSLSEFSEGISRFIIGLGKKVIIADTLATVSDEIFATSINHLTISEAWLGIICFSLQIYFDFSGYSDMAIGLAKMFGFKFPENFNYPYIASSIRDFWTRWHITLSNWFRDYLYIPLGGNRRSPLRNYANLWVVFLLVGLWHGASWNFIFWGGIQAFFLSLERIGQGKINFPRFVKHFYTILAILIGWVFFRSENLGYGALYLGRMFGIGGEKISELHPIGYFLSNDVSVCIIFGMIFSLPIGSWVNFLIKKTMKINFKIYSITEIIKINFKLVFLLIVLFLSFISVAIQTYNPFLYFRF